MVIQHKFIQEFLNGYAEKIIGEYQCGVSSNITSTDQINIYYKTNFWKQENLPLHIIFIDFKQACEQ